MEKKLGLIIFVHGFLGGKDSFKNENNKFFCNFLKKDDYIHNNYDFKYYTYSSIPLESKFINLIKMVKQFIKPSSKTIKKNLNIKNNSLLFNTWLNTEVKEYKNIVFISHSMGGIIVKRTLLMNKNILNKNTFYITLATPHKGIVIKNFLDFIAHTFFKNNKQFEFLKTLNEEIEELNSEWDNTKDRLNYLYCVAMHDEIVEKNSACPEINSSKCEYFDKDHLTISKIDENDLKMVNLIIRKIKNLQNSYYPKHFNQNYWKNINENNFKDIVFDLLNYEKIIDNVNETIILFIKDEKSRYLLFDKIENHQSKKVILAININLTENEEITIRTIENKNNIEVTIFDRNYIEKILIKYSHLLTRYEIINKAPDTVLKQQKSINQQIDLGDLNSVDDTNYIHRKEEIDIENFLNNTLSILLITGISGVGKSVIASNVCYKNRNLFDGILAIKFSETLTQTEFLEKFNHFFNSNNISEFNEIYINSNYSDEIRLEVLFNIVQNSEFIIIFDNFEDMLDKNHKVKNNFIKNFIIKILENRCKSKLIFTTKIQPLDIFDKSNQYKIIPIEKLNDEQIKDYLVKTLPNLNRFLESSKDKNILKKIKNITDGVPLILNALNYYVEFQPLDNAIKLAIEDFKESIFKTILKTFNNNSQFLLYSIAVADESIEFPFFKHFKVTNEEINLLVSAKFINFNAINSIYIMHGIIKQVLLDNAEKNIIKKAHLSIIDYYDKNYIFNHIDDKESHFMERKKILHYIEIEEYDIAMEKLGKIGTRFISLNAIPELEDILKKLEPRITKMESKIWLLNIKAHIADFKKDFNETIGIYKNMYKLSLSINNIELIALSTNNYATTFRRSENFNEAISYYLKAYKVAKKHNLKKTIGTVLNNLGQTYTYINQYSKAVKAFEKCIANRTEQNDEFRLGATHSHFGNLCLEIFKNNKFKNLKIKDKYYWLNRASVNIEKSIKMQKAQDNYWLIDRTYELIAEYWKLNNNLEKYSNYLELANKNRIEKNVIKEVKIN